MSTGTAAPRSGTGALIAALVAVSSHAWGAEPPDLSGTWAALHVETEVLAVPTVGDVTLTSRGLVLVDIVQEGSDLTLRERLCALRSDSDSDSVRTIIPAALVRWAPVSERPATLVRVRDRWELRAPARVLVYGADLRRPERDPLPTEARDARVRDADRDGQPGVTVRIDGLIAGDVHVVQRGTTALHGIVRSAGAIDGLVTWQREQRVLSATNLFLRTELARRPHPDRAKHPFRLRRVPEGTDCAGVRAAAGELFATR